MRRLLSILRLGRYFKRKTVGSLGTLEITQLLESGVDLNLRSHDGATPLVVAAGFGHVDLVISLLRAGADVNFRDTRGRSAIESAVLGSHTEIVRHLVEAGADACSLDKALALAALCHAKPTVRLLKKAGARPRRQTIPLGSEIWSLPRLSRLADF